MKEHDVRVQKCVQIVCRKNLKGRPRRRRKNNIKMDMYDVHTDWYGSA
jgi:hypothetical protein